MKKMALLLVLGMNLLMFYASFSLPQVGDANSPPNSHVSPRYIEDAYEETHSPNFVGAVLADYRGYDTLGETTVICVAGLVTALILRGERKKKGGEGNEEL